MKNVPKPPDRAKRLCIDIGATRLKCAVLPRPTNWEDLSGLQTDAMRILGWLNRSMEDLLNPRNGVALNHARRQLPACDSIAIGLCTELDASGKISGHLRGRGVPADLKERFERQTGKRVILINDAEAWLRGALTYCELNPSKPGGSVAGKRSLALIFGTAVGWASGKDPKCVVPEEFNPGFKATHLSKAAGTNVDGWAVHRILGKPFFDWVARDKPDWSYPTIRKEFTRRVIALHKDIESLRGRPDTLFIGGGNAEYVSIREVEKSLGVPVIVLREPELEIPPDLVPLLGLASIC